MPQAPDPERVARDVRRALEEDLGSGDLTASLVPATASLVTTVVCRESAVLAGRPWFDACFAQLDRSIEIDWTLDDGERMSADAVVCTLRGPARAILSGERTGLNFLQTLSANATLARHYVDAVAGTGAIILDTRKTLPGLRHAQKYAVLCGGAHNHRIGLFDAILVKENHIAAAGSISAAVGNARERYPGILLEVEVEDRAQLAEAAAAGADRALLDNFPLEALRDAVDEFSPVLELEASGGVNLETVRAIAETGVNFISVGALTKHVRAVDFSMRFA
ncbi:MAG: carboxylating nicotinate-nucleotide diphosphorylase [Xanthomonadales bacterium]|nr:carboxylating nicotinate-nucleotide diphosphorylase [Xanthomonadales bacterium]